MRRRPPGIACSARIQPGYVKAPVLGFFCCVPCTEPLCPGNTNKRGLYSPLSPWEAETRLPSLEGWAVTGKRGCCTWKVVGCDVDPWQGTGFLTIV